jgi:hypothetical protein
VKRSYYPALVQRLEAWIARREALAADALAYLRDGLDRNLPDYAEIVARVGTGALDALLGTPSGDVAREAALFLESRATPELRERLFGELRRASDGATVVRLTGALPGRLSAQETGDLLNLLSRPPSGPASSALLRALAVRLPATEDAALARSFEALDAAAGRGALPPADGAFYCVQRLKSVGPDRSETRAALERSLETLITAAEPKERIQVVNYLSSLRSGETPRLLSRLAGDENPQVAAAAGVSLARSLFEIRLPATDAILAKTLGSGGAPAVGAILDELSRGAKLPPGAVETAATIRRLADSAPSEAVRTAAQELAKRNELRK